MIKRFPHKNNKISISKFLRHHRHHISQTHNIESRKHSKKRRATDLFSNNQKTKTQSKSQKKKILKSQDFLARRRRSHIHTTRNSQNSIPKISSKRNRYMQKNVRNLSKLVQHANIRLNKTISYRRCPKRLSFKAGNLYISSIYSDGPSKNLNLTSKRCIGFRSTDKRTKKNTFSKIQPFSKLPKKNKDRNIFEPPFKILNDPVFHTDFDPFDVFDQIFSSSSFIEKVDSVQSVFKKMTYFGEGAFSKVFQVFVKGHRTPVILKSMQLSQFNKIKMFKRFMAGVF